jgi:acyl carrier protein
VRREEVLEVIAAAVARVLEVPAASVAPTTRLVEDLHADSLAIVEIVELVEEELVVRAGRPVRLDDERLDGLHTVGDAVDEVLAAPCRSSSPCWLPCSFRRSCRPCSSAP